MDDPMTIIQRHHQPALSDQQWLYAVSDISAVIGPFSCAENDALSTVLTWMTEEDGVLAQLAYHGVFIADIVLRRERYQIAGLCYLHHIPLFTDDDLYELLDKEATAINIALN